MRFPHVAVVLAVVLAACSGSDSGESDEVADPAPDVTTTTTPSATGAATTTTTTSPTEPPGDGAATTTIAAVPEYESAPANWGPCEDLADLPGLAPIQCATIQVPLDHADVEGPTIPIALVRQAAFGDAIGSVVFNPGGPGGSGREFLEAARFSVAAEVAERFHLVSFDPRGVGASAAVECDIRFDDGVALVADGDRPGWDALLERTLADVETCTTTVDDLAPHLGTNNAARDLDEIREAVGDELLTYVGFSYGTRLGSTYAELFPDRVRALVLDGAVAPSTDFAALGAAQGAGFDRALESFAAVCDADPDCLLRELGPTLDVIAGLRAELAEVGSFATDDGDRVLTPGELDLAIAAALYSQSAWVYLSQGLYFAETQQDGTLLQVLTDSYLGRQPDGSYDNRNEAGSFINCADDPARPEPDTVWANAEATAAQSRYFDEFLRASTGCLGFPDPIDPLLLGPAAGAPPILVIGTTGDPATPYEWSVEMAGFLDSGVLYTVEGEGHTAYLGIECVTPIVDTFLIDLEVPADGDSCVDDSDADPFPPAGESDLEQVVIFVGCLGDQGVDVGEYDLADALRDPSGLDLFADLFSDPSAIPAIGVCQPFLPS